MHKLYCVPVLSTTELFQEFIIVHPQWETLKNPQTNKNKNLFVKFCTLEVKIMYFQF